MSIKSIWHDNNATRSQHDDTVLHRCIWHMYRFQRWNSLIWHSDMLMILYLFYKEFIVSTHTTISLVFVVFLYPTLNWFDAMARFSCALFAFILMKAGLGYTVRDEIRMIFGWLHIGQRNGSVVCPLHFATSTVTTGRTSEAWLNCESLVYHWEVWIMSIPFRASDSWWLIATSKGHFIWVLLSANLANQIDRVGSISRYRLTAILALVKILRCTLEFETVHEWNRKK